MPASAVSPLLVGRVAELDVLRKALASAAGGQAQTVLVGGEAGVGKSRLVAELMAYATGRDTQLLTGACIEGGGEGMPFAPVVDLLRMVVRTTPPGELDDLLGRARPEVARLLPELSGAPEPATELRSSAQLFELLLGVLVRLAAAGPVLVVVEDLHWADQSTLDFVAFLARALAEVPITVLVTYRSDEMYRGHPLRALLATWERSRQVLRVELGRFTAAEVREQLTAILGSGPDETLFRQVVDRSEGNAFLVEEVLGVVQAGADPDSLPPSLRDVLLTRVEQLSDPARQVLRTASVAGRWVAERLLATVTRLPQQDLYAALREAVERHQLVVDDAGRGYAFRHALTRDAVYKDMLPGERGAIHLAYGEALSADPDLAGPGTAIAATLAYHWYAALDLPRALEASVEAAQVAASTAAYAEAQRHLERALEIWPRVPDAGQRTGTSLFELLGQAGEAAFKAGQVDRALTQLELSLAAIPVDGGDSARAVALERRAMVLHGLGQETAAAADLREAMVLLGNDGSVDRRAALLAHLAHAMFFAGDADDAGGPGAGERVAGQAVEAAREAARPDLEADALITLGTLVAYRGDVVAGAGALRRGIDVAGRLANQEILLRGYVNLSDVLELAGDHEEAVDLAARGVAVAAEAGFSRNFGVFLLANQMEPLVRLGRWQEAEAVAAEAMRRDPSGVFRMSVLEVLAELAAYRGEYDTAERHLQAASALAGESGWQYVLPFATTSAEVKRARGELEAARATVLQALASRGSDQDSRYALPLVALGFGVEADLRQRGPVPDPPAAALALESLDGALSAMTAATPRQRAFHDLAAAERARATLPGPSTAAWQTALESAVQTGDRWLRLYVRLRLAYAMAEEGDRTAAAAHVRRILSEAAEIGAGPLHDQARDLASRARLAVAEPDPVVAEPADAFGTFGLTQRERVVLSHVAAGSSNGQIAAALFISPKTASVHVSNILAKLGVSGRGGAAAMAHRLGIEAPDGTGDQT
jgi:ATP/maltotriose-dependent transcriptional regulator MalT